VTSPRYELTAHAATVNAKRGIDGAWLERALSKPERTEQDKHDATLTHALARVPEYGDRLLRVVYNASVDPPRVITAYFDRRLRGKP
jgi:hypothetical protein